MAAIADEIGRRRHHAELAVLMCLHHSNAPALALAVCDAAEGGAVTGADPAASPLERRLQRLLAAHQAKLVSEACSAFEHGRPSRGQGRTGTIEEILR